MKNSLYKPKYLLIVLIALLCSPSYSEPVLPNIILLVADDIGIGDSRVYNSESKIPMPNLEKLAQDGLVFSRTYIGGTTCAPSRYSLITGNHHWRGSRQWGTWVYTGGSQIQDDQLTIADSLKQAGYLTGVVGKYHLGGDLYRRNSNELAAPNEPEDTIDFSRPLMDGPLAHGFDYSYVLLRGIQDPPYAYFENDNLAGDASALTTLEKGWHHNFQSFILKSGIGHPEYNSSQVGQRLTDKALAFMALQNNVDPAQRKPFFLYFPTIAAHTPFTPPVSFDAIPLKDQSGINRRVDMVREFDVTLGILLRYLEEKGLEENTLVIVSSDNGPPNIENEIACCDHDSAGGWRGKKGDIWEGGTRVPLVMRWGDGTREGSSIPPNSESQAMVSLQDIAATINSLVGITYTENQFRDSVNFLPVMLAPEKFTGTRRTMLIESRSVNMVTRPPHFAIVDGNKKLIINNDDQSVEFYDLANDPSEESNLLYTSSDLSQIESLRNEIVTQKASARTAPLAESSSVSDTLDDLSIYGIR